MGRYVVDIFNLFNFLIFSEVVICRAASEGRHLVGASSTNAPQISKMVAVDRAQISGIPDRAEKYDDSQMAPSPQIQATSDDGAAFSSGAQISPASQRAGSAPQQQQQQLFHFNSRQHEENHHEQKLKELSQSGKGSSGAVAIGVQPQGPQSSQPKSEYDAAHDRRPPPAEDAVELRRPELTGASAGSGRDATAYDVPAAGEYDQEGVVQHAALSPIENSHVRMTGSSAGGEIPAGHSNSGYNPVQANMDHGNKGQQNYPHSYNNEEQQSFEDPMLVNSGSQTFQHKTHLINQDGARNVGSINNPDASKPRQNVEESGRHYSDNYEGQASFPNGHPDKSNPNSDSRYESSARNFGREHGYDSGYQSSESEYVPQPNAYPQEVHETSQNRHSLPGQAGPSNSWSSNQNSYEGSYSRNGQFSDNNMGSAQQAGALEPQRMDDQQSKSLHPQHSLPRPNYDKDVVGPSANNQEEQGEYWASQRSGQQSSEGKVPPSMETGQPNQEYRIPKLEVSHVVINKGSEHRPNSNGHTIHKPPSKPSLGGAGEPEHQSSSPKGSATSSDKKATASSSTLSKHDSAVVVKPQSRVDRVEVSLAEVEVNRAERSSESNGAVFALTLGLSITGLLLVLVGCRLRMVRRRLRRGRSPYAHDADYLVNGMYL